MSVLVMDLGTSGVRSAIVHPDASVTHEFRRATLPNTPVPGLVEFDALVYANHALECARETLAEFGKVAGLGISNQRATTIVWDRATGQPVAPAQGWQDLRTVGDCLGLNAEGFEHSADRRHETHGQQHQVGFEQLLRAGDFLHLAVFPLNANGLQTCDLAFVADESLAADALLRAAAGADKALISGVRLFDRFAGERLGAGKISLAIEVTLQPTEKSLTDAEIEAVSAKVLAAAARIGAVLRG